MRAAVLPYGALTALCTILISAYERRNLRRPWQRQWRSVRVSVAETRSMMDIIYLVLGIAFLIGCVAYTYACERL